ncbi:hypothetical protein SAICODRAFT_25809 [Saitoella complicata NRRL Y-17804]|uniref:Exportin-4 n=1 Tax=Saitoella complicata (strain BCRC 22490 / CBS 7301 / JCM 7358 / NBRC 10748 / NRRL Y-17804) TaxID=698492 RepID=A0A0E9NKR2_SAICN|nr:uncharacterized protein SAICODRAFT_25809 [Saitoella complicata NRRL Y-17804]ODQ52504.1 hypothetical protein SAICODRAFT_25809 [Saitoella complicata NRRL Y-17804]GAO50462.1 hypothetical protein G7K_4586-t1 [Saitoella complicata NRRL Y-17804]
MDYSQLLQSLESVCGDGLQTARTRTRAEEVIQSFKGMQHLLPACRFVLEHTHSPQLQFHSAAAVREAVAREFSVYRVEDIQGFEGWLLEYCSSRIQVPRYVRDALMSAVATIAKRLMLETGEQEAWLLLEKLWQLRQGNKDQQVLCLSLATALLDEFGTSSKSSPLRLSLEMHHQAKKIFMDVCLIYVWQMVLETLHSRIAINAAADELTEGEDVLLNNAITVSDRIISWDFQHDEANPAFAGSVQKDADADDQDTDELPLLLPASWQEAVNNDVIGLLFMVYQRLQGTASLASNHCRHVLIRLANVTGPVFTTKDAVENWCRAFLSQITPYLKAMVTAGNAVTEIGPHSLGLAKMARAILVPGVHTDAILNGDAILWEFLGAAAEAMIWLCREASRNGGDHEESSWLWEAFNGFAGVWAEILKKVKSHENNQAVQHLRSVCERVSEAYVQCRLESAAWSVEHENDEELDIDQDEKDWEQNEEQLTVVATLARESPKTMVTMLQLLTERVNAYKMAQAQQQFGTHVYVLHEHMHWLLLVSGFVLAEDPHGDPEKRVTYVLPHIPDISQIVLTYTQMIGTEQEELWSPQVVETLWWWLERWTLSYLYADSYPAFSGDAGREIASFIIDRMKAHMEGWASEASVILQIAKTLKTFAGHQKLRDGMLLTQTFHTLVEYLVKNIEKLPEAAHGVVVETVTIFAAGATQADVRAHYMSLVMNSVEKDFVSLVQRPDFSKIAQQNVVFSKLIDTMDMFQGLCRGVQPQTVNEIFDLVAKYSPHMLELLKTYGSVPEMVMSILKVYVTLVQSTEIAQLAPEVQTVLTQHSLELMKVYDSITKSQKESHEIADEPYGDVILIMEFLSNLVALDLQRARAQSVSLSQSPNHEVILYGWHILLPKVTADALEIPQVAIKNASLIRDLVEYYPDKLTALPDEVLDTIRRALSSNLGSPVYEVVDSLYQGISAFALFAYSLQRKGDMASLARLAGPIDGLLETALGNLLFGHVVSDLVGQAAAALLPLICCSEQKYETLVRGLLDQHAANPDTHQRLVNAFTKLTAAIPPELPEGITLARSKELGEFNKHLFVFLNETRGILMQR